MVSSAVRPDDDDAQLRTQAKVTGVGVLGEPCWSLCGLTALAANRRQFCCGFYPQHSFFPQDSVITHDGLGSDGHFLPLLRVRLQ